MVIPVSGWQRRWVRWTLAAACAVLGMMSLAASMANVLVRADPARAHVLAPGNGIVAAAAAQALQMASAATGTGLRPTSLARSALLADGTAVDALLVLAFDASLNNDTARSDRLFAQANRLTRRELRAQIWAIEDAINQGDVSGALRNYDIALRTSADAPQMLFATLGGALSEPRVRSEVLEILEQRPLWAPDFLSFLANSPISPRSAAALFAEAPGHGIVPNDILRAQLVDQLVAARAFDEAFSLYSSFRPGVRRTASRDPNFTLDTKQRSVLDWHPGDESGLSVAILPGKADGDGAVDFALSPQAGGTVLRQLQLLPPGRYRVSGVMTGIDQPRTSRPYWLLTCESGLELGRADLDDNGERFSGTFRVPQGCSVQTLALVARPSDKISGVTGQVRSVTMTPLVN